MSPIQFAFAYGLFFGGLAGFVVGQVVAYIMLGKVAAEAHRHANQLADNGRKREGEQ